MKKIISALAVSALVFGSAAAKTSVNLNYRNGAYLYSYTTNGEDDAANVKTSTFGGLDTYQGGQDTMSFKASGDILDFQADIQPKVDGTLRFNTLKIGAKWGAFHTQAGWCGDGLNGGYRVTNDASNFEGLFFETFKLGSAFANSFSKYSDNQINIGGKIFDDREMYAQADYTIAVDDLKINVKGTVISNRTWKGSSATVLKNNGDKGWSVFVDVAKSGAFKAEAFIKGAKTNVWNYKDNALDEGKLALVPGAYFQWLGTEGLILTAGGSASLYNGKLSDYNMDLRARYAVDKKLSITYYLKYSSWGSDELENVAVATSAKADDVTKNLKIDKNVGYNGSAITAKAVLWNFLNARYVLNPTVTLACGLGALTDVAQFKDEKTNGTTLSVIPSAEFFAGKGASITVGTAFTLAGLGSDDTKFGEKTDFAFAIPVLFRVKM